MNEISFILNGISTVVRGWCPTYILDGPVYMGEVFSALFVLSHTNGARRTTGTSAGTGTGMGMGTTGRARAEIPTTHLLCAAANS